MTNLIKKTLCLLAVLLCTVAATWADEAFRQARYDNFKVLSPAEGSIIMIGNSITDQHIWNEVFRDASGNNLKICNRGVSGSYATVQSENIESYIANKPSKVFMMIGTNDIATSGGLSTPSTPEVLLSYVKSIVNRIHKRSSATEIYLYPILKNNTSNRVEATWTSYNTLLKNWVTETNASWLTFVDFYDDMANVASGSPYSNDNLHPNAVAYKTWCDAILKYMPTGTTCDYDVLTTDLTSEQKQTGLSSMAGARATMFSVMPIKSSDILIFGDGEIKTAEWWELLGNTNVKNRGNGWSSGGSIATASSTVDNTFTAVDGITKACPKAIFLYTGTDDVRGATDIATVESNYKTLVEKIQGYAPDAKIYLMAQHPTVTAATNTGRITEFNSYLESLAGGNIKYVDTYTPLVDEATNVANSDYIYTNNYLYGKGAVVMANAMANAYNTDFSDDKMSPVSLETAIANYSIAAKRNTIGTAITAGRNVVAGTKVGEYTEAAVTNFQTAETAAYGVLAKTTITDDEVTSTVSALNAGLAVIAPTKDNTSGKYFRLYTPNRGNRYLTNNDAGSTMTGTSLTSYDYQVWQLEGRDDGTFDVKSVYDDSYMSPTSPITTSATKPTNGWTFTTSSDPSLFIITCGTSELNQQNASPYNILNWGGGSNKSDAGCQYKIVEVDVSDFKHPVLVDGKYYTIAGYVARNGGTTNYVFYDGTTRTMSTTAPTANNGVWKAVKADGGWKFESVKAQGKYLTYDGADATGAIYTITDGVSDGCVSMRPGNSYYSASSEDGKMGGSYKSSNGTVQSDSYNWSTDWKLTETEVFSNAKMPTMPETTLKSTEITSKGWYIFEYQKPTGKFCSAGQFLCGYETEPTWSSASFIPLLNAQTMTNANFGQSLFYLSNNTSSAGNGYNVYMLSPTGHYLDGTTSLGSSVREGNAVHLGYETSSTDAGQCNVYIRTGANGSNLAAMTVNSVNSFGGTGYSENLAFFHVAKVVPTDCGVTPWKVTITGVDNADVIRNDTQISYIGEGNVGFSKVYNNGTFFIDSDVIPAESDFSAPTIDSKPLVTITVNSTDKTVTVAYTDNIEYTINSTTAKTYRSGEESTAFCNVLKTNDEPQVQLSTTNNNMQWSGSNIAIYPGGSSCTYTLSAPTGYLIDSYSFTATNISGNTADMTLTIGDKTYATKNGVDISYTKVNESSVTIVIAGENKGVVLTDFIVKIKVDKPEKPEMSTTGDEHWYYIENAAASTVTYCTGKVMYADASDSYKMKFGTKQFNGNYLWSFWEDSSTGKIAIKNYNKYYIGTAGSGSGGSTQFCAQTTANYIYSITDAYDYFTISDGGTPLHAQQSGSVIVRWGAAEGNASLWRFVEADVTNSEVTIGSTTVQQGRVTTGKGNTDLPIIRATIKVNGLTGTADLTGVKGKVVANSISDITKVKAYMASNARELVVNALAGETVTWRESNATLLGTGTISTSVGTSNDGTSSAEYTIKFDNTQSLAPGTYYLWIALDIADNAKEGNKVDATITSYTIGTGGTKDVTESNGNPSNMATIFLSEGTVLMPKDKGVDKTNGSTYYRIPAITQVTKNGKPRLVTLTDDRKEHNSDLPSHCYLVGQYSDDYGKTWSEPKVVAGTAETGGDYGHGDASLVTNRDNGEITGIMVSCGSYLHGFFAGTAEEPARWRTVTSKDGGVTWSTPKDFTDDLYGAKCIDATRQNWLSGFSGSGAALQMRDGTLVSSFVNRETTDGTTTQNYYFFMSNDGGATWHVSGTSGTTAADEPKALERNNGDLAISVRASGYNYHNISSDRGKTWKNAAQTRFTSGISGNACDGDYMVWCSSNEGNNVGTKDGNTVGDIAFQTCPNSASRQNLSIALSTDEGETFESVKTICPSGSAYSSCAVLPDGTLGVYYEENGIFGGYTMRFVRFSLDWASDGKYKFTTEHPFKPIASTKAAEFGYTEETSTITVSGKATADEIATYVDTKSENAVTNLDLTNANVSSVEDVRTALVDKSNVSKNLLIYTKPSTETTTVNNVVVGDQCTNLVLTDGEALEIPTAFTATTATYSRNCSNAWGTVCLPYAVKSGDDIQYYELSSVDDAKSVMKFNPVTTVAAGTPAVFKVTNTGDNTIAAESIPVNGTLSTPETGFWKLHGTYTKQTITDENGYYILGNKFWQRAEKTTEVTDPCFYINPFRGWFTWEASGARSSNAVYSIDFDDATGINAVENADGTVSVVYDLNGRRQNTLQKGINIVNGRKVIK